MIQKAIIKKERYSYDTTSILCPSGTSTFSHAGSGTAGNDPLLSGISLRCQRRRTCRTGHTGSTGTADPAGERHFSPARCHKTLEPHGKADRSGMHLLHLAAAAGHMVQPAAHRPDRADMHSRFAGSRSAGRTVQLCNYRISGRSHRSDAAGLRTGQRRCRHSRCLSHLAGVQGHCSVHHIYHEKNAALCAERGRNPVKKRILVVAAAYGLVLLGWGATGSFSPWARSQTAAPAAVETIQLEHLSIRSGKSTSIRTADRCITKQRGTTLSVRPRLPLFPSDSDVTLTLPAEQFAQLKQALQTTERSN